MNVKVIVGAVVGLVALVVGYYVINLQREAAKWNNAKEIDEATFTRSDNTTTARFVGVVDGPIDKVQEALWDVEHGAGTIENIQLEPAAAGRERQRGRDASEGAQPAAPALQDGIHASSRAAPHHLKTTESQLRISRAYLLEASPDGKRTRVVYEFTGRTRSRSVPSSVLERDVRPTIRGLSSG
jgi:hypothetical protein